MLYGIAFRNLKTGQVSYYTGKASGDWLSTNIDDCLFGYSLRGVNSVGRRMLTLHSLTLANHEVLSVTCPVSSNDSEGGSCD